MSEMIERVARAICAHNMGGFCDNFGHHQGCKVGRGERYNASNCAAGRPQLQVSLEWAMATEAIKAMRDPTDLMGAGLPNDYRPGNHSATQIWQAMIDAAVT